MRRKQSPMLHIGLNLQNVIIGNAKSIFIRIEYNADAE